MPVVVGVLSTPEGTRALDAAVTEAARRATVLVLVPGRPEESADPALAAAEAAGVDARLAPPSEESEFAARLVEAAQRTDADVVVIGLRRRSPVGKLILGAGAQRILLDAPCPVLAVKPES